MGLKLNIMAIVPKNNKIKNKMKKPEIIIEKGREKDELSSLSYEFFNAVNEYNKEHTDRAHVVVLACDSKGGASFMVGDTETCVKEFCESVVRHKGFLDLFKGILDKLQD